MKKIDELLKSLTAEEKTRLFNGKGNWNTFDADGKVPTFSMADGPHGVRKQDDENYRDLNVSKLATCFPTASALASSWNLETIQKLAHALADEAIGSNVDVLLGCGVNMKRSPLCGRNFEYFSEDPYLAGILAAEYVKTLQADGVAACPKHFAANNQEKRRMTSNSLVDERTMNEIYLRAFEIIVKNSKPKTIMAAYNRVNGKFAGFNKRLLTDTLRNKWGFDGVVISDWGACINPPECIKAGMDLAMPDSHLYFDKQIKAALENGTLSESDLDKSASRVLKLADEMIEIRENRKKGQADLEENNKIAVDLATDCAVLLKNEGLLPLKQKEVCVIGELAEILKFQGGGSSHINTPKTKNILESLEERNFKVEYEKGYLSGFVKRRKAAKLNKPYQKKALELAKKCASENKPIIFCCGLTDSFEGEGFDRDNMLLPPEQKLLLTEISKITKDIVVVTFAGAPIDFSFEGDVNAILHMHYAGQGVGEATAILLSGEKSPSGKLSETYPLSIEDTPCYGNFSDLETDDVYYKEEVLMGYRHYQTKNIPVCYEFGYGLSYSKFEYSDLSIEKTSAENVSVSFTIKNVGNFDASEIAQVYVKNPQISKDKENELKRAEKELRGFAKVFLKAGESKKVTIKLDDNSFKVFSTKKDDFAISGGKYTIQVGQSVKNIKLEKEIEIEGEKFEDLVEKVRWDAKKELAIDDKKGKFSMSSSLYDMSKKSFIIRAFLAIILVVLRGMNHWEAADSPIIKIQINTIKECPVEALISTSGGSVNEGMARFFVWCANHRL